jgi:DNA-directed RNA polymerase subunit E'/Rpb7
MNSEIFIPIKFVSSINLKPFEVNDNIEDVILKKIKEKYEGLCTKHGYIKKNSIKIIKRSIGNIIQEHFNSTINFNFQCVAEIFNPVKGSIIKAIIQNKNEMGILAKSFYQNEAILEVIIPKISAGIKSDIDLTKLNIGDEVYVEIYGKKFILYDKFISIIGKAINKDNLNINNDPNFIENDEEEDDVLIDDDDIIDDINDNDNDDDENKENNEDDEDDDDEEDDDEDEDDDDEDDDTIDDEIVDDDYEDIEETLFDD